MGLPFSSKCLSNTIAKGIELHYLIKRVALYIVILMIVVNLVFFLPRLVPGNAAYQLTTGFGISTEVGILTQRFGLNQPIWVQYVSYMKGIFATWPPYLGVSFFWYPEQVTTLIAQRLVWTLLLIFSSLALAILMTFGLARVSAQRRGGKVELGGLYAFLSLHSIPVYWLAMVMLWTFGIALRVSPVTGTVAPLTPWGWDYVISVVWHAILPVVVLALSLVGQLFLVLRGSIQEALKSDYVMAAKSRGLSGQVVAWRYTLRNSLLPIVSLLTFSLSSLVSRAVLVEAVFGYIGIGDLIVDGIIDHDYPVIAGSFIVLTVIIIIGGLIGDILLMRLDPRLRK